MSAKQTEPAGSSGELVPVKFSRLTRRGVLLGLSLAQLITLATGVLSVVGALYAGGGLLLAYTAPVWVIAACLTWIPVAGRPAVEWLPVAVWWLWRTTGGQLLYRRRVVKPRPVGTLALPGDQARLRDLVALELDAHVVDLEHEIERAIVVDARQVARNVVTMNSRALLHLDDEKVEVALVYPQDADDSAGKLSVYSDIGTAILGYKEGDAFDWRIPNRTRRISIEKVLYQPEAAGDFDL